MANMFGDYPNVSDKSDEVAVPASKLVLKARRKRTREERDARIRKTVKRQVKKQLKRLKAEQEAAEKAVSERVAAEKAATEKAAANKDVQQFFVCLGKAVCKAVPGILTILATAVIGHFFGVSPKKKGWQPT